MKFINTIVSDGTEVKSTLSWSSVIYIHLRKCSQNLIVIQHADKSDRTLLYCTVSTTWWSSDDASIVLEITDSFLIYCTLITRLWSCTSSNTPRPVTLPFNQQILGAWRTPTKKRNKKVPSHETIPRFQGVWFFWGGGSPSQTPPASLSSWDLIALGDIRSCSWEHHRPA